MATAMNVAIRQFGSAFGVAITVALVGTREAGFSRFMDVYLLLGAGGMATAGLAFRVVGAHQ
jgi:hypothetical protein